MKLLHIVTLLRISTYVDRSYIIYYRCENLMLGMHESQIDTITSLQNKDYCP